MGLHAPLSVVAPLHFRISVAFPLPEGTMAVGFESEEIHLYRLRERLRAMSDEALITFGKQTRLLCGIRVSGTADPYKIQLREARQEWRRRHSKHE
jgi:hypothetical protein